MIEIILIILTFGMVVLGIVKNTWNDKTNRFTGWGWGVVICAALFTGFSITQALDRMKKERLSEEKTEKLTNEAYKELENVLKKRITLFIQIYNITQRRFLLNDSISDNSYHRKLERLSSDIFIDSLNRMKFNATPFSTSSDCIGSIVLKNTKEFRNELNNVVSINNRYYDPEVMTLINWIYNNEVIDVNISEIELKEYWLKEGSLCDLLNNPSYSYDYLKNYLTTIANLYDLTALKVKMN